MGTMAAALLLPSKSPFTEEKNAFFLHRTRRRARKDRSIFPVARLFGPAIFEASKLKVLFLGAEKKHPGKYPRTYTLTHSDITSKLTLAISQTINNSQLQGWYNKLQRDEVVAEWKKIKGKMSLHVHCHISGGHFLLDLFSRLRYYIFCKELPVVLKAFVHGDEDLFNNYPELEEALVWVYFHSNIPEFNKVECWGPLRDASAPSGGIRDEANNAALFRGNGDGSGLDTLQPCPEDCSCCFPPMSLIPWPRHAGVVDDLAVSSKSLDVSPQSYMSGGSS
ncbi:protein STAY-GREEN homolog, chloroplastic-like [Salvia miltiorrhiza]|uniref:protein STAY-GREEN homolog, chloroplastic-like n=1 Tax=Salvia miltiorrhiza TaxID=226208 RepID=UPI0025AC8555|nr:protein STAY-GREEN homolog, chloroplastic-like [Salvia miltiorrhiza]